MPPSYSQIGAALDGISKQMVAKHKKAGMPTESIESAAAWYRTHVDISRTKGGRIDRVQTPASRPIPPPAQAQLAPGADDASRASSASSGADTAPDDDPAEPIDENAAAYRADRARNERIKAERGDLELAQLRGTLIDVRQVEELQFTAGRITRDRVLMVPARVAAELHALLLTLIPAEQRAAFAETLQVHAFERRLDDALRDALTEAEKAIEDAGRDDDQDDNTT